MLPSQSAPYSWFGIAVLVAYALSFILAVLRNHRIKDMGRVLADDVIDEAKSGPSAAAA